MQHVPSPPSHPSAADSLFQYAMGAIQARQFQQAIELIRQGLSLQPRHLPGTLLMAKACRLGGQIEQALVACAHANEIAPDQAPVLMEMALCQKRADRLQEARQTFEQLLALAPDQAAVHHNLANVLQRLKEWGPAEQHYRQALVLAPNLAEAHFELGNLMMASGRGMQEARLCWAQALSVRHDFMPAWDKLSRSLQEADGIWGLSEIHNQAASVDATTPVLMNIAKAALAMDPESTLGLYAMGFGLRLQGHIAAALEPLEQAISKIPEHHPLYRQCVFLHTLCLMDLGEHKRAVSGAQRLLALAVDAGEQAKSNQLLAGLALDEGASGKALQFYKAAVEKDPQSLNAVTSYCAAHLYATPEHAYQQPAIARELIAPMLPGVDAITFNNKADPDRPLKIGYLSGDFRQHSCAYFLLPLIEHIDRNAFSLYAYATEHREDHMTTRFKALIPNWRKVNALSDEAVADQIRADGIDILVDLTGLTDGHRLMMLASKPAPVILNWLGFLGSTGVPTVDWRITDEWVDPVGYEWPGCEPALRLPRTYVAYAPPADAPDVTEPPMLKNGFPTFGSFNSLAKLSDACLETWCTVLKAMPDSRMMIKSKALRDPAMCEALLERIAQHGVSAERFILRGWENKTAHHLEIYSEVDIALDSYPFNGVTTTCEASWMGVPVVSLVGQAAPARQGLSLLSALGRPDRAAKDLSTFVHICQTLASHPEQLRQERSTARQRMASSPLMNGPDFAQTMGALYRQAWRNWCATPSSITVSSS